MNHDNNYTINFEFNFKKIEENENHIITEFQEGQIIGKEVTIIHLDKNRDEGTYSCVLMDQSNRKKRKDQKLVIFNTPKVLFENVHRSIKVNAGDEFVKLFAYYQASPKPIFKIDNPRTNYVYIDGTIFNKTKYDVKMNETTVELTVKHIDIDDYGKFLFLATFNNKNSTVIDFKLIVNDKPNVTFTDLFVSDNRSFVEMHCYVMGYPKASTSWSEYKVFELFNIQGFLFIIRNIRFSTM